MLRLHVSVVGVCLLLAACGASSPSGSRLDSKPETEFRSWTAEPAYLANTGVYRQHEFVFQDYVHDDRGANTDGLDRLDLPFGVAGPAPALPPDPRLSPAPLINNAGDFTYATSSNHRDDVADLIELRVAADAQFVYYRVLLADLTAPDSSVIGVCVDEDMTAATGLAAWPFGAGLTEQLGCDHFYTVYGSGAQVTDAQGHSQDLAALGGSVSADVDNATIEFRVPRSLADPGTGTWRYIVASGLWDAAGMQWSAPLPVPAAPGSPLPFATGGRVDVPNIWDVLANNHEPNSTWDEERQANDLTAQNILGDFVEVDFARLAEERDDPQPQRTGVVERLYRSQYPTETGKGVDVALGIGVQYVYQGPWQPYVAVIPSNYYDDPGRTWLFDTCMHPLGGNHNVEVYYAEAFAVPDYSPLTTGVIPATGYLGFAQVTSLIDRLQGVYACTLGRGEGLGYEGGDGLVDVLEVQNDMHRWYRIDDDRRTVHGVSLGAIGTWYVARLYPDQYAAAMPYIFSSGTTGGITADPKLANLWNLPVFFSIGTLDEFGQGLEGDPEADQLEGFGDEYVFLHYLGRQHEGRIENDFLPFTEALAYPRRRVKDPARVRYVFEPGAFSSKIPGSGSAYWVSGMTLRDPTAATASVDVTSLARADQLPAHQVVFNGVYLNTVKSYLARFRGLLRLTPDEFTALWHPEVWEPGWQQVSLSVTPSDLDVPPVSSGFTLSATNLGAVTLDLARMKIDNGALLTYSVQSDGPVDIHLSDGRVISLAGSADGTLH